jgi:hypothetical protein
MIDKFETKCNVCGRRDVSVVMGGSKSGTEVLLACKCGNRYAIFWMSEPYDNSTSVCFETPLDCELIKNER